MVPTRWSSVDQDLMSKMVLEYIKETKGNPVTIRPLVNRFMRSSLRHNIDKVRTRLIHTICALRGEFVLTKEGEPQSRTRAEMVRLNLITNGAPVEFITKDEFKEYKGKTHSIWIMDELKSSIKATHLQTQAVLNLKEVEKAPAQPSPQDIIDEAIEDSEDFGTVLFKALATIDNMVPREKVVDALSVVRSMKRGGIDPELGGSAMTEWLRDNTRIS